MKNLNLTIGSDLSAYANITVSIDEGATKADIIAAVRRQIELETNGSGVAFDEDWSTQHNLRIVTCDDAKLQNVVGFTSLELATESVPVQAVRDIDASFDAINSVLDMSGCLDSIVTQRAMYRLRLGIAQALADQPRIDAAQASLLELEPENGSAMATSCDLKN